MERKTFIKNCTYTCLGSFMLTPILQGCAGSGYFAVHHQKDREVIIKKSEFIQIKKKENTERKFVLLKSELYQYPICIYKTGDDHYTALLMECTHKSCELQAQGEYLVCPCHGSEFTKTGAVQNPPAEENLKSFITRTDHENIYIQL